MAETEKGRTRANPEVTRRTRKQEAIRRL